MKKWDRRLGMLAAFCAGAASAALAIASGPALAAEQKIGAPPEAHDMRLVGYSDLQGRSAYQPTIHEQNGRWIAYIGHHGGTPEVPKPVNPLTGQQEFNGTSLIDVTDPKHPKYLAHITGELGRDGDAQGTQRAAPADRHDDVRRAMRGRGAIAIDVVDDEAGGRAGDAGDAPALEDRRASFTHGARPPGEQLLLRRLGEPQRRCVRQIRIDHQLSARKAADAVGDRGLFEPDVTEPARLGLEGGREPGRAGADDHEIELVGRAWPCRDGPHGVSALVYRVADQRLAADVAGDIQPGHVARLQRLGDGDRRCIGLVGERDRERAVRALLLAQDEPAAIGGPGDDCRVAVDLEHVVRAGVDARVAAEAGRGVDQRQALARGRVENQRGRVARVDGRNRRGQRSQVASVG